MIDISNLSVHFDDKVVLSDISCIIEKDIVTTIIGKSGTGKSVLMKTVLGLIEPTRGDVTIDKISLKKAKKKMKIEIKKKTAMLFQSSALFDSMTILQNVGFPLYEHTNINFSDLVEKVIKMLQLVDLTSDILDLYPSDLSGGMKKRVALARAIIQEPEYIIYDEPTTGLDPLTAEEIIRLIDTLNKELKMTSIVITHDPECIKSITQKLIMLDQGKLIFNDDFSKFSTCTHPIVKSFAKYII